MAFFRLTTVLGVHTSLWQVTLLGIEDDIDGGMRKTEEFNSYKAKIMKANNRKLSTHNHGNTHNCGIRQHLVVHLIGVPSIVRKSA